MQQKFGLLLDAKVKGANNIRRLGNDMQGVQGKVKNLGMAVRGLGMAFKALAATAAVAGFAALIKGAADQADAMGKLATRTGIAADKLQGFVNAGKLADVSQEQLTSGLRVFARTQAEAAEGVATYADAYAKLGVSVTKSDGSLKASDALLGEIADRFADLPDGPAKAAVAMDIFGRSGAQMITMLNGGSAALEEFNYELSENFAENAQYFNDLMTQVGIKFEGFRLQLMDAVMPALIEIAKVFGELFATENDWNALFNVIGAGMRGISIVVLSLVKLFDELIRTVVATAQVLKAFFDRDLGRAREIGEQFRAGFMQRAATSYSQFDRLAFGSGEAPDGYQLRTGGTSLPTTAATAAGGRSAAAGRSSAGNAVQGQFNRLQNEQELLRTARLRLQDTQRLFAIEKESDALKRLGLEFEREREQLLADHSEAMRGQVSIERSLVAADQLKLDLQRVTNREQEATAELLKTQTAETSKLGELFTSIKDTVATGLGNAIEGLIDGTKTLGESLSGIIKQLSRMVLQFGMQSLVGGIFPSAKGNVFASNGIVPFARGGVVGSPTLFPFAKGVGLMGEAGPEAIMPLRRGKGGRLGVEAQGGIGGVVVNVDAGGTQAQGDTDRAQQLGNALGAAVRAELIKQKRPGGILS